MSTQSPVSEREGTLKYSGDLGASQLDRLLETDSESAAGQCIRLWPERKAPKTLPRRCVTTLCVLQTMMQQMTICSNPCRQVFLISVGKVTKQ